MFRIVGRMRATASVLLIALTAIAAGCRTSTAEPSQPTSSRTPRVLSHCTDVPAPELGAGTLCISNGFRVNRDNFSFANWGRSQRADDNVTAQTLIDLFGYDAVCAPGTKSECMLRPTTAQFLELWNTALAGGRCEGLAALSARLHLSLDSPAQFGSQYSETSQLTRRESDVNQSIVYWWATQFVKEVKRSAADSRRKSPLALVDQLIQGLANSLGYTVGLYFESQGHSVTPFAVTNRDDHFVVHVYDNNFPNQRREILVNKVTDTWTYLGASTSIDGSPVDWTGSTGSFELTSMSSREGPFTCPFCFEENKDAPSFVTLASRDAKNPGYLRITSRNGDAQFSPSGFTTTIDGATADIGKGGGNLLAIQLPAEVKEFDISVVSRAPNVPAGDVVVSLIRPGYAQLQVGGNAASTTETSQSTPVIRARKNNTTVIAPPEATLDISLARNGTLITKELEPLEEFDIARADKTEIEISVKGATTSQSLAIAIAGNDISQRARIIETADSGLEVEVSVPTPMRARPQQRMNFIPRKVVTPKKTTTTSTSPSIEISEPD